MRGGWVLFFSGRTEKRLRFAPAGNQVASSLEGTPSALQIFNSLVRDSICVPLVPHRPPLWVGVVGVLGNGSRWEGFPRRWKCIE